MSAAISCPPAGRIKQLGLGKLSDDEHRALESHVLTCDRCAAELAQLNDHDSLLDALGKVFGAKLPSGKAVDVAIQRACELSVPHATTSRGDTAATAETARYKFSSPPDIAQLIPQVLLPAQAAGEIGRLGPYRVLKLLDYGGMGLLFLAEDTRLERRVALKAMQPRLAASPDGRKRFMREAKAAAALRHDHIVTIYQVSEDQGPLWLAMELLEGKSLDQRLKEQKTLPVEEAVRIGRETAMALAAAHDRGLVHRDIKPANIWLESPNGRVKVLDFGLARTIDDSSDLTQSSLIVGTPAYMAPEQARGQAIDARCDLFSLGCVLYRMLAGQVPFRGKNTMAVLTALANYTPPPVHDLVADVPAALGELIARLLAKDPAARPQTAAEVARELAAIESDRTLEVLPPPPPVCHSPFPTLSMAWRRGHSHKPMRISRIALVIASVVLLGGLTLAGVLLKIMTPAGTIVVEIDQPDLVGAEVSIDGQQRLTIQSADSKEPIRVVADEKEHTLKVTKGGFETYTRQFTVKAGRQQAIRVRLEKLAENAEATKGQTDPKLAKKDAAGLGPSANVDAPSRPLGARGPISGRGFDPANAGGPIRQLTTDRIKITSRGVDYAERHLSRFGPDAANQGMVQRLRGIAEGRLQPTQADLNFYSHELRESVRYRQLGFPSGQPLGADAAYELWNNAHTATLEDYMLREGPGVLYHPSVGP